jgi:hypothetical protein
LPLCFPAGSSLSRPGLLCAVEGAQDAADSAADDSRVSADIKSKGTLRGQSALPDILATVADQNADLRSLTQNYRDPAGAIQQGKAAGVFV